MKHFTLFNGKRQASVFIPFGTVGSASRDRSDREYNKIKASVFKQ